MLFEYILLSFSVLWQKRLNLTNKSAIDRIEKGMYGTLKLPKDGKIQNFWPFLSSSMKCLMKRLLG